MAKNAESSDLTHQPAEVSYGTPYKKEKGGRFRAEAEIPSTLLNVGMVAGIATFMYFVLGTGGVAAILLGLVVVLSITVASEHPKYATKALDGATRLMQKLKSK